MPVPVSEWPSVKPLSDAFDTGVYSVWGSLSTGGFRVLKSVNICFEYIHLPHVETSLVTNSPVVAGPSFIGALLAWSTAFVGLYGLHFLDWIHPITDGYYFINLYFF